MSRISSSTFEYVSPFEGTVRGLRLSIMLVGVWLAGLAVPQTATAEFILAGFGSNSPDVMTGTMVGVDLPLSGDEEEPSHSKFDQELKPLVADLLGGGGSCSGSSSTSTVGSSFGPVATLCSRVLDYQLQQQESLIQAKLLIPPRPDPLEMLDPPKRAA